MKPKKKKAGREPDRVCDHYNCSEKATNRGWVWLLPKSREWRSLDDGYKRYRWWCDAHYLEYMFGLWALTCTPECREERSKKTGVSIDPNGAIVWIRMEALISLRKRSPARPKCPWCGKAMRYPYEDRAEESDGSAPP